MKPGIKNEHGLPLTEKQENTLIERAKRHLLAASESNEFIITVIPWGSPTAPDGFMMKVEVNTGGTLSSI